MGTRSLTAIQEYDGREIVVIYRQFDGYPSGMGADLHEFLNGFQILSGYNEDKPKLANGMGCLAAQLIKHLKDGIGNVYLKPAGTRDCWEEYLYTISPTDEQRPSKLSLRVEAIRYEKEPQLLFTGPLDLFGPEKCHE